MGIFTRVPLALVLIFFLAKPALGQGAHPPPNLPPPPPPYYPAYPYRFSPYYPPPPGAASGRPYYFGAPYFRGPYPYYPYGMGDDPYAPHVSYPGVYLHPYGAR